MSIHRIGKYRVLDRLGAGGMGLVFRAEDERLRRPVAIKLLPPALALDSEARARLQREAQSVSALDHPNICTIYEIGDHEGQLFIAMACYEGLTLRQLMDRGRLPVGQAAFIAAQIARGVERAHEAGIVHRDIKPANVMVTSRNEVKLLDFGLAKGRDALNLTAEGAMAGTPAYMSPEQVEGRAADQRVDVWALGVITFEMLAGEAPFRGASAGALLRAILQDDPEPLKRRCPGISRRIEQAVHNALVKDPALRAGDVHELRAALEGAQEPLELQTLAPPPSDSTPISKKADPPISAAETGSGSQLKSVAVLPFANRSPEPDQTYFCEGLADELITGLTRLNRFRVASRSSAMRPSEADAASIGRSLKVDAVLEGSVRRAGQKLRVSVQLVEVATGFCIWSDRYDRELQDVFEIQEDIAQQVVRGLSGVFGPEDRARLLAGTTEELEAYEYYLRGRMLARQGRRATLEEAIRQYERAIEIDPNYALAYAGIAGCQTWLFTQWGADRENLRRAGASARKAVELAPNLAEAHAALAACLSYGGDRAGAERELDDALRLNSRSAWAQKAYGDHCFREGDMERAADFYRRAMALDPARYELPGYLSQVLFRLGRIEECLAASRHAFDVASHEASVNPGDARACYMAGIALLRLGERERGLEWIDRAVSIDADDLLVLYNIGCAYALAGEPERALDALERALVHGFGNLRWLENDSDFDSIREHPRFGALLDRVRAS